MNHRKSALVLLFALLCFFINVSASPDVNGNSDSSINDDAVDDGKLQIGITESIPEEKCKRKTKSGDVISVHYEGKLEDGKVFDSSFKRNQPISFQLGSGRVIKGWDQGLTRMCIGEKRKLVIPHNLAYGESGIGPIPPRAKLIFDVELVDIAGSDQIVKDEL